MNLNILLYDAFDEVEGLTNLLRDVMKSLSNVWFIDSLYKCRNKCKYHFLSTPTLRAAAILILMSR